MMNTEEKSGAVSAPVTFGTPIFPQNQPENPSAGVPYRNPVKERIPIPFSRLDALFAALFLVCGYFFVWLIHPLNLGFGVTLFTLLFCGMVLVYCKKSDVVPGRANILWLVLVLLAALPFSLYTNAFLQFLNLILLMGLAVYWVASLCGTRLEPVLGRYFVPDLVNQLFQVPFRNFGCAPHLVKEGAVKNRRSKTLLSVLLGVLVSVPILGIVFSLLIQADTNFQHMVQGMLDRIGPEIGSFLLRLLPAFLTGSYLFGLLYGNVKKRNLDVVSAEKADAAAEKALRLPPAFSVTVMTLMIAVYALFFSSQSATLLGAFQGRPPEGFTYAEYARRGFFELCQVVFINMAVMLCAHLFTRRDSPKGLRICNIVLSVETVFLIVTALSKMVLYINQYGLTQKRVYTSFFMALLLVVFVLIIAAQFVRFNLTRSVVLTACISFLVLCCSNADGLIAQYNVDRYLNGTLKNVDVLALYTTSDAARPAALRLLRETQDAGMKADLSEFYENRAQRSIPFQEMNLQRLINQNQK